MKIIFKHDIDGLFGKEYIEEATYNMELAGKALRAFKKDVWSTLWLTEMGITERGYNKAICFCWESFDDYEANMVTVTTWHSPYEQDQEVMPWVQARKLFVKSTK